MALPFPNTGDKQADANFRELDKRDKATTRDIRSGAEGFADHEADTTSVHGITDTSVLATDAEVSSAVATHEADTSTHGSADLSQAALKNAANTFTATPQRVQATGHDGRVDLSTAPSTATISVSNVSTSDASTLTQAGLVVSDIDGHTVDLSLDGLLAFLASASGNLVESRQLGDADNRFTLTVAGAAAAGDGTVAPTAAGFRSTNSLAGTDEANTFTKKQIIAPDSDTQALDLRMGTGTTAPFRIRNNADSTNLASFTNVGKLNAVRAGFGSGRVEAVGDATAPGDAVSRSFGDNRYLPKTTDGQGTVWPTQGQPLASPTSTAAGAADRYRYCTVIVAQKCTVTGIRYKVGATSAGDVGCTLYNSAGNQVTAALVGVAQSAINTRQAVPFGGVPSVIEPGLYTALLRFTDTTATAFCWAAADFLGSAGEGSGATPGTRLPPSGLTTVPVPAITLY